MNINFFTFVPSELPKIKKLWEKLNAVHLSESRHFQEHYRTFTFEKRCEKFLEMSPENIRIEVATADESEPVGYCISTFERHVGEIESLYLEPEIRKNGIGGRLVENAIAWLKANGCEKIQVSVAEGHESVFRFYEKFGFYPRLTILQWK
jgi:ribosomal protein S18 acetylase RimI-like enzyme